MDEESPGLVKTTATSFKILEFILHKDGARQEQVADKFDLSKSTAHRHLRTLQNFGYVVKGSDIYEASFQLLTMGAHLRRQIPAYPMIRNKVDSLAEQTGERVQFVVAEKDQEVYIYTSTGAKETKNPILTTQTAWGSTDTPESDQSCSTWSTRMMINKEERRDSHTGKAEEQLLPPFGSTDLLNSKELQKGAYTGMKSPIYPSATGKAILAHLPLFQRRPILNSLTLEKTGPNTITDMEEYREHLETVRNRGYAFGIEESLSGVHGIGIHIEDEGEVIGAIGISGPATRLNEGVIKEELPEQLLTVKREIEREITHS